VQHFYLGMTQAEVAAVTGLTPKQVSRLWGRALVRLGSYLLDAD
jgi:DNA-directed RNA polymerase specialized sigma subunit